jgi:nitrogen regulatory protein PII
MKRITTVLKESEAMAVRKAVCTMAGAERVVITPIPFRVSGVDMSDVHNSKAIDEPFKQVRLDVTTDDSMAGSVIAVIRRVAHAGRVDLASLHDRLPKRAA